MREIKFRAWDGKKMRVPEYSDEEDFYITCDGDVRYQQEVGYERHLTNGYRKDWALMQFTGLHDKNGKEIYEGDVLTTIFGEVWTVEFVGGCFAGMIRDEDGVPIDNEDVQMLIGGRHRAEVIGHIYENPQEAK